MQSLCQLIFAVPQSRLRLSGLKLSLLLQSLYLLTAIPFSLLQLQNELRNLSVFLVTGQLVKLHLLSHQGTRLRKFRFFLQQSPILFLTLLRPTPQLLLQLHNLLLSLSFHLQEFFFKLSFLKLLL